MNISIIIPARIGSSRFPMKPLYKIKNIPMIIRTCNQCAKAFDRKKIFVATDSKKIFSLCKNYDYKSIMIKDKCLTGTDRVALASKKINSEYFINLQGDEPIFNPADIKKFIKKINKKSECVFLGATKIKNIKDFHNTNIPKLVINKKNELIYASRSPIPFSKKLNNRIFRQVLIYGFTRKLLSKFYSKKKTLLERLEDIEILRFIEMGVKVKIVELSDKSKSVDVLSDVKKVIKFIK